MNIETMMHSEICARLELMGKMDPATEEYQAIAEPTLKLIDRATKMEELNIKLKEMAETRRDRIWDRILRGVGIALPPTIALVAAFGFSILERTDSVTSTPAREFMRRALRLN